MKNGYKAIFCTMLAILMLISLAACGGGGSDAGRGDTSLNTIDWDSDFFGTTIPNPDGFSKTSEFKVTLRERNDSIAKIEIDGLSYKDYVKYCKKLEALSGWASTEGKAVSDLPENENPEKRIEFEGSLPTIDCIRVAFYSSGCSDKDGNPFIRMFVYESWS